VAGGTRGSRDSNAARDGQSYTGETPAPASATYETVNLFGRKTGHRVKLAEGEMLPALPRGFAWVVVGE
jgi:hypothetical protein